MVNHESRSTIHEKGQVVVEFALIMPLILFVTMGLMQLSLIFVARSIVNYASYTAARAELVGQDPQKAAEIVCSPISGFSYLGGPQSPIILPGWGELPRSAFSKDKTTVNVLESLTKDGDRVTVEVTHEYQLMFPEFVMPLIGITSTTFSNYSKNGVNFITLTDTCTLPKPWPGL